MKSALRIFSRTAKSLLILAGLLALLGSVVEFSPLPWRAYQHLTTIPAPGRESPTYILVMGGSGIPGRSGLMRTFYAAQAAAEYPRADILIAMPLGTVQSVASRAYLDELRLRGVDSPRLRILDGGRNTREQALRLAEYLADRPAPARILIVSSPEHMRRTAACLRKTCAEAGIELQVTACPAFDISIEDPLPWHAAELDTPGPAPVTRAAVPDIGASLCFRYNLWNNLGYTIDALREGAALLYYRLRGWI